MYKSQHANIWRDDNAEMLVECPYSEPCDRLTILLCLLTSSCSMKRCAADDQSSQGKDRHVLSFMFPLAHMACYFGTGTTQLSLLSQLNSQRIYKTLLQCGLNVGMVLVELMAQAKDDLAMIRKKLEIRMSHHQRRFRPKIGPKELIEDIQYHNVKRRAVCHFQSLLTWSSALKSRH